jgi:Tfp pilus assembly protein PilE
MGIKTTQQMFTSNRGFTLLIALIFMSVMLAFGLALASLAYKQSVLASSATDSQYAFYAADAGLECALYADQQEDRFAWPSTDPDAAPSGVTCDGNAPTPATEVAWSTQQWVLSYLFSLAGGTECVDVTVYKPNPLDNPAVTYMFSQGYNVSCATVSNPPAGVPIVSRGIDIQY